ncbi:sialin-like [Tubulanus polymorphus]|uniref:sialin-like n=1 Tax=Tubulanus polymorphus TaxID=672921 RepID=UPI003DA48348
MDPTSASRFCSTRYILAYVGFFGFMGAYALRFNMSVAIVCMVKTDDVAANGTDAYRYKTSDDKCNPDNSTISRTFEGEFDWDRQTQGWVLSSFFWGYIITQIPAGWIGDRFGSKIVFGVGVTLASVATILLPIAARGHVYAVIFLRFVMGLSTGVIFPAMHGLWARWAPVQERTTLMALTYSGTMVGNIFAFFISGILCQYVGWSSIFYVIGGLILMWSILWFTLVYDSPELHPRISPAERSFILANTSQAVRSKTCKIPWVASLKSGPMWAILAAHVCSDWGGYTMMTSLPTYMNDVLYFDIKQNGIYNALPYIGKFLITIFGGEVADAMRKRYSTTAVRKFFQITAFLIPTAFTVATGYLECTQPVLAVTFLVIAVTFSALSRCAFTVNHVDIAPRFAGMFFGVSNSVATIPGMLAPIAAAQITYDRSRESWLIVFYICAAFYLFGAIVYAIFASGVEQEWAKVEVDDRQDDETRAALTKSKTAESVIC